MRPRHNRKKMMESGPVSRILYGRKRISSRGDHFSGTQITLGFKQPTRGPRPGRPFSRFGRKISFSDKPGIVPLFGFAPGDAYPATCVTTGAVGSYPTISPLPGKKQVFCHRRYIFCGAGVGSLRLGVTQHLALWSPDFPLTKIPVSSHPAHSHHQFLIVGCQKMESKRSGLTARYYSVVSASRW